MRFLFIFLVFQIALFAKEPAAKGFKISSFSQSLPEKTPTAPTATQAQPVVIPNAPAKNNDQANKAIPVLASSAELNEIDRRLRELDAERMLLMNKMYSYEDEIKTAVMSMGYGHSNEDVWYDSILTNEIIRDKALEENRHWDYSIGDLTEENMIADQLDIIERMLIRQTTYSDKWLQDMMRQAQRHKSLLQPYISNLKKYKVTPGKDRKYYYSKIAQTEKALSELQKIIHVNTKATQKLLVDQKQLENRQRDTVASVAENRKKLNIAQNNLKKLQQDLDKNIAMIAHIQTHLAFEDRAVNMFEILIKKHQEIIQEHQKQFANLTQSQGKIKQSIATAQAEIAQSKKSLTDILNIDTKLKAILKAIDRKRWEDLIPLDKQWVLEHDLDAYKTELSFLIGDKNNYNAFLKKFQDELTGLPAREEMIRNMEAQSIAWRQDILRVHNTAINALKAMKAEIAQKKATMATNIEKNKKFVTDINNAIRNAATQVDNYQKAIISSYKDVTQKMINRVKDHHSLIDKVDEAGDLITRKNYLISSDALNHDLEKIMEPLKSLSYL